VEKYSICDLNYIQSFIRWYSRFVWFSHLAQCQWCGICSSNTHVHWTNCYENASFK